MQASGGKRLILDLRNVNTFSNKMYVKYEDWRVATSYFTLRAYMFSIDVKTGYHHIEIFEGHQLEAYLGFSWRHAGSNCLNFFFFTALPFGLASAPTFSQLLSTFREALETSGRLRCYFS